MKVLILTYTYPPASSVNGQRPYYFAKALKDSGHTVEVLTRHFTGHEKWDEYNTENLTPFAISKEDGIMVYRTPFKNTWFDYYSYAILKNTGLWKWMYLIQLAIGRTTQESYNHWFKKYLNNILANGVDLVLVESGPTNLVILASKMCSINSIPYCIDFRDVYYHEMLWKGSLSWNKRLKIYFEKRYMAASIRKATLVIGESKQKLNVIKVPKHKSYVIHNGYDEELWASGEVPLNNTQPFTILVAGRLYAKPFLEILLDSFAEFITYGYHDILIRFLAPGDTEVINRINHKLEPRYLEIIPERVSAAKALSYMKSAHVLAYHGWQNYTGVYSTKIYDYIRSGKRILICPTDSDVMEELLSPLPGCHLTSDSREAAKVLQSIYTQWKANHLMDVDRNHTEASPAMENSTSCSIYEFSRQYQSKKIVGILENAVRK